MKFRECKVNISFSFIVTQRDQSEQQLLSNLAGSVDAWLREMLPNRTIGNACIDGAFTPLKTESAP